MVIAIIGTLAAVLLPALGNARSTAKRTMCLSNLKGMLNGIHAYAVDHSGAIPYGPMRASTLYPVPGMVTSQLSVTSGEPAGLGLMLRDYLGSQAAVVFCPGSDVPLDSARELSNVGKRTAICDYFYRHGGNTLAGLRQPPDSLDDHIVLENLGRNSNDQPIRALIADNNFRTTAAIGAFGVTNHTNHKEKWVHAGYADGHAEARRNVMKRYSVDVGGSPHKGPDKILAMFEKLDVRD